MDIKKLNSILPTIENQLPLPIEFKRTNLNNNASIPNASINKIIFGSGDLGPTKIVAAYCLPNYEEIRSNYGSKQIIYASTKNIEQKLNPILSRKLFNSKEHATFLDQVDPEMDFDGDLWNLNCILHETIGHGSGKAATHTFQEGENRTIENKTYKVGDTIAVTSKNIAELLNDYTSTLEELRAEIIALYVSIEHTNDLIKNGFLEQWSNKMSLKKLQEELILNMAKTALRRYIQQSDNAKVISGDHARANCTITNYLIEQGGIERVQEKLNHEGKVYNVIDLKLSNFDKARQAIKELMFLAQQIKSTGDGVMIKKLVDKYGIPIKYPEDMKILKANRKAIVGDIKSGAHIFPQFIPVLKKNRIVDVKAQWPKNIFEQYKHYASLELSKEY